MVPGGCSLHPVEADRDLVAPCGRAGEQKAHWLLRNPSWTCWFVALPFGCASGEAAPLAVLYHWPKVDVPVYYFMVRPALEAIPRLSRTDTRASWLLHARQRHLRLLWSSFGGIMSGRVRWVARRGSTSCRSSP